LTVQDKFENETLLANALPVDIWFHVDDLSSAHVYLRLPKDATVDAIPADTLEDCCQLVKANSIEGCKRTKVNIVYTPASNLKKTGNMYVIARGCTRLQGVVRDSVFGCVLSR
jgi:predicted ribosome quality control (RQC) complex YloA/Tae2 family protein